MESHDLVSANGDALSILNLQRQLLDGPEYLHHLVNKNLDGPSNAIEFVTGAGEIRQFSYRLLDKLTSHLAAEITDTIHSLKQANQTVIIPVLIAQSPELYISWLAILKAGAAFCPVGLDVPEERIKFVLEDTSAIIVLTTAELRDRLAWTNANIRVLTVSAAQLQWSCNRPTEESVSSFISPPSSNALAYVMYTSGSTGQPKGVKISHRAVTQALLAHDEHMPPFKRFLQFASPTFDVSVFETFFPLFRGATLVSREREFMLADLPGTITNLSVDAVELTPTVVGMLLKTRQAVPSLKLLLTIGEMLTRRVIEEFGSSSAEPGILWAMYGPTEASIHCTVVPNVHVTSSVYNIGKPLATVTVFIIKDSQGALIDLPEILPIGHTGELVIAGQLASGYLNRAEQTKAAFIQIPGYGMAYRTGDRGRITQGGNIEIHGRLTAGQVKIRGQRVELGEIEQVACRADLVQLSVAAVLNDMIVLFCITDGVLTNTDQVRAVCKSALPRFMLPGDIVLLESAPRLPSGKIDRKVLEAQYLDSRFHGSPPPTEFENDREKEIASCISEEFDCSISRDSSLWARGLDSLKAIKIAARLRRLQFSLGAHDLLELDTIALLAAKSREAEESPQQAPLALIEDSASWTNVRDEVRNGLKSHCNVDKIEEIIPCSTMQIAMLMETMANTKLNFNYIQLRSAPGVTESDVYTAFNILAQKNEILRSGFVQTDSPGIPTAQIIWRNLALDKELSLLHPLKIEADFNSEGASFHVKIHHALYDGWSWDLILSDLNLILNGESPPDRTQFRFISREQRSNTLLRSLEQREYWQGYIAGAAPVSFPQLKSTKAHVPGRESLRSALKTSQESVDTFSRRMHISRQSVLSSAAVLLISSYTGSADVIIGSVSSGRTLAISGIEESIGPCLVTWPLRVDLSQMHTVRDLLLFVHSRQINQLEFERFDLRGIKDVAGFNAQDNLFDTLFVWQESLPVARNISKRLTVVETYDCLDYTMVLEVEPMDQTLGMKLTYSLEKIPSDHAQLFLKQFDQLLTALLCNETLPLDRIWSTIQDEEILAIANPQFEPFNANFDMVSTIERLAREQPLRSALEFIHDFDPETGASSLQCLTYGELWQQCRRASEVLLDMGIHANHLVCILAEKSIDLYVTILAVVVAGAGYTCVDRRTPQERIFQIIQDSDCKLVICDTGWTLEDDRGMKLSVLSMQQLKDWKLQPRWGRPRVENKGSHLAYTVFTSGTTGLPKGIQITRNNISSNIDVLSKLYPCQPGKDRLLQACSPAFDVSVFEIFWTWHMGMTLVSSTNNVLFRDIESFIRNMHVTHLSMTPSVAALVNPLHVSAVKFLVTAGEPMNYNTYAKWTDRGLFQGYGPSETTNICTVKVKMSGDDLPNNVGPPFSNTSIFVCAKQKSSLRSDKEFQVLPLGAVGEIVIGGEQVGRGYISQDLTARSFIETKYGRLYRSGDFGRLLVNKDLIILGREDDQVKLRGQRIELGDVTSAILKSKDVADAVTLILNDSSERPRLVSYWLSTAKDSQLPNQSSDIFDELSALLPTYMIPEVLIPVDVMPLTKQGKIDKAALIQGYRALKDKDLLLYSRGAGEFRAAHSLSAEEMKIAVAVSEVTGTVLTRVGPNTSLFAFGIDSLNSIRLSQKLKDCGFGQVDVSIILRQSSVRRLSLSLLASSKETTVGTDSSKVPHVFESIWEENIKARFKRIGLRVEKLLPCTSLQEAMLSQSQASNSSAYRNRLTFRLLGDQSQMKAAWRTMISRHQILRTGFVEASTPAFAYAQVVLESFDVPWHTIDEIENHHRYSLDQLAIPPYQLRIEEHKDQQWNTLTLSLHHAMYDAEAMALLLREIEQAYYFKTLPTVVSFESYLKYKFNMDMDKVDDFWSNQLYNHKPRLLAQALSGTRDSDAPYSNVITHKFISRLPLSELQRVSKQYSTTLGILLQTTWVRLLSSYLKTQDICFGSVFSGRNLSFEGADRIIGPCFNTLPIRTKLKSHQTVQDLVAQLHEINMKILPYQPSALRRIVRNRNITGTSLFDSLILLQREQQQLDERIWALEEDAGNMAFPIILEIIPDGRSNQVVFKLHIEHEPASTSIAQNILENFDVLLDENVRYSQRQTLDFSSIESELPRLNPAPADLRYATRNVLPAIVDENLTGLECEIQHLFSEFSAIDASRIGRNTTLFDVGLDSLSAVQLASRLRQSGHYVNGADVLEARTVGALASFCGVHQSKFSADSANFDLKSFDDQNRSQVLKSLDIDGEEIEAVRPCTPTQSGILAQFINSQGSLYFNSIVLRLDDDVDLSRLKNAWAAAMDRHEILRAGFVRLDSSKHPFGMITYRQSTEQLPWLAASNYKQPWTNDLLRQDVLKKLHQPCWRLVLQRHETQIQLHLYLVHSLYDAQSLNLLVSEIAACYRGDTLSIPIAIGPVIARIITHSLSPSEASEKFFSAFAESVQPTSFPDLKTYQETGRDISSISHRLTMSQQQVSKACKRFGASLQAVCQIAWAQILAALTGESNVAFGVILSGRTLEGTDQVLFPTINTVPFLITVTKDIDGMLAQAMDLNIELTKHQFTPMSMIKRWLNVENTLFDTLIVLQKYESVDAGHAPWSIVEGSAAAEYAVSIEVIPHSNSELELRLTAREDVLPKQAATLLLKHLDQGLRRILFRPHDHDMTSTNLLSVVPAKDKRIWTEVRYLHEFVKNTATRTPDKTALEFASSITGNTVKITSWTYRQLDEQGNKIAHWLISNGAIAGNLIAVCFDKCPEASFAILGVLKAGCAYVAIDPAAPESRKDFILKDSKCKILLTTREKSAFFQHNDQLTVLAADDAKLLEYCPLSEPKLAYNLQPGDTCYCLYTSGTTGTPKGCLISHDSVVQAMLSFQRIFEGRWNSDSRWLQFASFHFDVSVLEQYWSWSVGICVASAPRDVLFEDLPAAIAALKITHLDLTPSLARLLTPEQAPSLCQGVFIVGGEQVRQDIIETWGDAGCLFNFYGPSEVTIGCTVHRQVPKAAKATNIGQQWDNVGTFVLEPGSQKAVIRGAVGELCLSGPLVGKGYLNRPDLTAEKFVHLQEYDVRVYRSGDLVRLLHDNSFEILGRLDDQVKLRGQRLEIGEVNHIISQASNSIGDVATMVLKHRQQTKEQLTAFFSVRGNRSSTLHAAFMSEESTNALAEVIRKHCINRLPTYMVPTYILPISHIPLSANNKADLKALKALFDALSVQELQQLIKNGGNAAMPENTSTKLVTQVIAAFLDLPLAAISLTSRLFEIGIDSISAIGLASALRKAGFVGADVATVLRQPVVADLAYALNTRSNREYMDAVARAQSRIGAFRKNHQGLFGTSGEIEDLWPCTPLQEDMLSKASLRHGASYYMSAFHFLLDPSVDIDALEAAWVYAQHVFSILRTVFVEISEKHYGQLITKYRTSPVRRHNGLVNGDDALAHLQLKAREWGDKADVFDGRPCWELEVVETTCGRAYMSLRIFHGLYDAVSLNVILEEIAMYLRNQPSQRVEPAFHDTLAYGPLCSREGASEFWTKNSSVFVHLELPVIYDAPTASVSTIFRSAYQVPPQMALLRGTLVVTEAAIFHAAWLLTLYQRYSLFPTLGMVVSGRNFPLDGVESVAGPLLSTIPCQISPQSGWTWGDIIQACHEFSVGVKAFEHTSLRDIRKLCKVETARPFFDSLFVFQKNESNPRVTDGLWIEIGQHSIPDYPLAVEIELKSENTFVTTIVADSEFLNEVDANLLCERLTHNLQQLCKDSSTPLDTLSKFTQTEQHGQHSQKLHNRSLINSTVFEKIRTQVAILAHQDPSDVPNETSIFQLGLDSVDAIRLSSALKSEGILISANLLMRYSTLLRIAQYATEKLQRGPQPLSPRLTESSNLEEVSTLLANALRKQDVNLDTVERVLPVTSMQEGILANYGRYYHFSALKLRPETDQDRLYKAWNAAIQIHPILRTSFVVVDDSDIKFVFAQLIAEPRDIPYQRSEVTNEQGLQDMILAMEREVKIRSILQPSVTLSFVTVKENRSRWLLLGLSHAIYDGESIKMLHQDVARLYSSQNVERPSYQPYLEHILNLPNDDAAAFWKRQLTSYKTTRFPRIGDGQEVRCVYQTTLKSQHSIDLVRQFCMRQSVTVQSLGLCCWTIVLSKYLNKRDVCFGVVLSGRATENASELLFPTFNTIAFRPHFKGNSRIELLRNIHELGLAMSAYQDFPLREIKKLKGGFDDMFESLFILQKTLSSEVDNAKLYDEVEMGERHIDFPVNIELGVGEDLIWTGAISSEILTEAGTQQLLDDVDETMRLILEDPDGVALTSSDLANGSDIGKGISPADPMIVIKGRSNYSEDDSAAKEHLETAIREVLALVAGCDDSDISAKTSLFSLGLDSISAIKAASMLKKSKSISLPVSKMLQAVTVEKMVALSTFIDDKPSPEESAVVREVDSAAVGLSEEMRAYLGSQGISEASLEAVLPATPGQVFMLDFFRASEGKLFFPIFRYKTSHDLKGALLHSWKETVARLPILRTKFIEYNGATFQVIFKDNSGNRFESSAGISVTVDEEPIVSMHIHHALYDAVSLPLIISALDKPNFSGHSGHGLKQHSLVNFVNATMSMQTNAQREHFWTNYLKSSPITLLDRGSFQAHRTEIVESNFMTTTSQLTNLARHAGISPHAIFYAACGKAYSDLLPTPSPREVIIGMYLANRGLDIEGLESLPAPTVNIVPLRIDVFGRSLLERARQIQEDLAIIRRAEYCGVSLRDIYRWTGVRLDCFVNFVKVPEAEADVDADADAAGEGQRRGLVPYMPAVGEEVNDLMEKPPSPFIGQEPSGELPWCRPSLDIEASINPDGHLVVGVFAPSDMLDEEEARRVVEGLQKVLLEAN